MTTKPNIRNILLHAVLIVIAFVLALRGASGQNVFDAVVEYDAVVDENCNSVDDEQLFVYTAPLTQPRFAIGPVEAPQSASVLPADRVTRLGAGVGAFGQPTQRTGVDIGRDLRQGEALFAEYDTFAGTHREALHPTGNVYRFTLLEQGHCNAVFLPAVSGPAPPELSDVEPSAVDVDMPF